MNGRVSKILRKCFLDGMTATEEHQARRYIIVQHGAIFKPARGGFVMVEGPRSQYQIAKKVFHDTPGKDRPRMIAAALQAVIEREKIRKSKLYGPDGKPLAEYNPSIIALPNTKEVQKYV